MSIYADKNSTVPTPTPVPRPWQTQTGGTPAVRRQSTRAEVAAFFSGSSGSVRVSRKAKES